MHWQDIVFVLISSFIVVLWFLYLGFRFIFRTRPVQVEHIKDFAGKILYDEEGMRSPGYLKYLRLVGALFIIVGIGISIAAVLKIRELLGL